MQVLITALQQAGYEIVNQEHRPDKPEQIVLTVSKDGVKRRFGTDIENLSQHGINEIVSFLEYSHQKSMRE